MCWAEQPFTVTPEHVAAWIERRHLPTGPSGNALRHSLGSPDDYAIVSRMDMGMMWVLAGLRATGYWGPIAAEFFEGEPPITEMGRLQQAWLAEHPTAMQHA